MSFGNTITLTKIINQYTEAQITVDTGPYGLVLDGGLIYYGIEITGEGVDVPVVDVYRVGGYMNHWIRAVQELNITATGRDGLGGTALRILQDDDCPFRLEDIRREGLIRAYGNGAVGLHLAVPLDVYCFNIETEGDDSTAIYAEQGANVYYCKLKAAGNNAVCLSGNSDITLDTCSAIPAPQNISVINRKIVSVVDREMYWPVKQFEARLFLSSLFTFELSGDDGFTPVTAQFLLENEALYDIDTSTLGITVVPYSLFPPFCGLGLEDDFKLELIVDIRDPLIPCISRTEFF